MMRRDEVGRAVLALGIVVCTAAGVRQNGGDKVRLQDQRDREGDYCGWPKSERGRVCAGSPLARPVARLTDLLAA